jgi:hypothetical protein
MVINLAPPCNRNQHTIVPRGQLMRQVALGLARMPHHQKPTSGLDHLGIAHFYVPGFILSFSTVPNPLHAARIGGATG